MGFDPISYILAKRGLGLPTLKGLVIDTSKDWQGYRIMNLGEPTEPYDAADYEIGSWIAPADAIPVLRLGVYTIHFKSEIVSGGAKIRFFFRLYERQSNGTEILIIESTPSNRIGKERENVVTSAVLTSDYIMASGSRLVLKLYARWEENKSATVRVYYQGAVRSRLATPIAKEILDTIYASIIHASQHALGGPDELSLDASQITSGVLSADRIPGLDASKIVSGVLDVARIPDLSRSKITDLFSTPFWDNIPDKPFDTLGSEFTVSAGELRIAGIDASKITSGVLDAARIPGLDASKIVSGRFSLSRLPTSSYANRFLVIRTANADPVFDVLKASDIPNLDASKITSGVFDVARIPNLSRSKITDFWSTPFWDNIPDKPAIPEPFYSTTDDLSDVTIHKASDTYLEDHESLTLFDITGEVKLLCGLACSDGSLEVRYKIDGASLVEKGDFTYRDSDGDTSHLAIMIPIHATSSLKVYIYNPTTVGFHYGGMAVTKCPFLDEKKPNALFDVDKKTGEIRVIHESQRVIDPSGYIPPEGCKHVHLVGEYELDQLPKGVPLRYLRYKDGKFERAKWGYVFRKEVTILGQKQVLWERTFEFDRELSQEEIKQIEEQLGAKLVRVI